MYITTQEFNNLTTENLKHVNLTTKADIDDLVERTDFVDKLKHLSKKVTSYKTKNLEAQNKLTDLKNKVTQIPERRYNFLLNRMYFTSDNGYQNF